MDKCLYRWVCSLRIEGFELRPENPYKMLKKYSLWLYRCVYIVVVHMFFSSSVMPLSFPQKHGVCWHVGEVTSIFFFVWGSHGVWILYSSDSAVTRGKFYSEVCIYNVCFDICNITVKTITYGYQYPSNLRVGTVNCGTLHLLHIIAVYALKWGLMCFIVHFWLIVVCFHSLMIIHCTNY